MKARLLAGALAAALLGLAGQARAEVEDIRLGAAAHNFNDDEDKEPDGVNVNAELVFSSPSLLEFLGSPRPYVMASVNTAGDTSWAGIGLYWRWEFADGWALEPGLGYVIHDGEIDIPDAEPGRILFGSRDLFRDTIALEREWRDHFATQIYFEHLSHGQIIGSGRNQGTEELGFRAIWRLTPH